jgi:hypothetical protein
MFPLDALLTLGSSLIDKFFPDKTQAETAKAQLLQMQVSGELAQITGQIQINKVEAANANLFVSGWRPAIGWVCAMALAYQYLLRPLLSWATIAAGYNFPVLPGLDDNLWQLMMGMLGMGVLRTFEKVSVVAS